MLTAVNSFLVVALMFVAVKFAPLVTTGEAPKRQAVHTKTIVGATPDAWMANSGLGSFFSWLKTMNDTLWYRGNLMWDHWLRIGHCEQPGGGFGGIDWRGGGWNHVGLFEGGLGILAQAWDDNNFGLPESALLATPEQQMMVATRIFHRYSADAWSCK